MYPFLQKIRSRIGMNTNLGLVVRNMFWAMIGRVVAIFTTTLVGIFVARYLGPDDYGIMNFVISYVAIFSTVASFGLDNVEIRELSYQNGNRDQIMGTAWRLRLLFAAISFLLVAISLLFYRPRWDVALMILLYAFSAFFSSSVIIANYFVSIVKNEYVIKPQLVRAIGGTLFKFLLLFLHAPLIWFIFALLLDSVLVFSGNIVAYRTHAGSLRTWSFDGKLAVFLIRQSVPLFLSSVAVVIFSQCNILMLKWLADVREIGFFSIAMLWSDFALFIPNVILQALTPMLIRVHAQGDAAYRARRQEYLDLLIWIGIFFSLFLTLAAPLLILFLYGKEYLAAGGVLMLLAWRAIGSMGSTASGQIMIIEKIHQYAVIRNVIGCLISIGLNLLLIPKYGARGAAVSAVITAFCAGILCNVFIPRYRELFTLLLRALFFGWRTPVKYCIDQIKS